MKIFGFNLNNEKHFVNITCNVILSLLIFAVLGVSVLLPISATVYQTNAPAYYYGDKNSSNVSLMINVYWGTEYLDEMLQIFEDNDITTTFFIGGCWAGKNNEYLKKIYEKGHEIGNHGYFHKDHAKISADAGKSEIYMTEELIKGIIGVKTTLFAPPSGSLNEKVLNVAENLGYKTIMWSLDTIDWRDKDENLIFKRATEKTAGGDLILMHPTECTVKALDKIIKDLKSKGLTPTTVSKTLGIQ